MKSPKIRHQFVPHKNAPTSCAKCHRWVGYHGDGIELSDSYDAREEKS